MASIIANCAQKHEAIGTVNQHVVQVVSIYMLWE